MLSRGRKWDNCIGIEKDGKTYQPWKIIATKDSHVKSNSLMSWSLFSRIGVCPNKTLLTWPLVYCHSHTWQHPYITTGAPNSHKHMGHSSHEHWGNRNWWWHDMHIAHLRAWSMWFLSGVIYQSLLTKQSDCKVTPIPRSDEHLFIDPHEATSLIRFALIVNASETVAPLAMVPLVVVVVLHLPCGLKLTSIRKLKRSTKKTYIWWITFVEKCSHTVKF